VENVFASLAADLDADSSPRAAEGEGEADEQVLEDKEKAAGAASNKQQHHQHNQQQQQQQQQQRDNSSLLGGGGGMLSAAAWCWKDPQSRSKTDIMTAVKQLRHWEVLRHAKAATLNVIAKTAIAKKLNEVRPALWQKNQLGRVHPTCQRYDVTKAPSVRVWGVGLGKSSRMHPAC
jgi:hypothetical protein